MAGARGRLIATLQETVELLERANERGWAFRLRGDLERIDDDDGSGIDHLLSAYGGMGSLSDLYLCAQNGHSVSANDVTSVNEKLNALTSKLWELARELR
jgi:hypothetical protein